MALADNRTQLQDCEAVGDVAGDSTADPQSNTTEAGVVIQGSTALQFQVTNAQEYLAYDQDSAGATFNLDLSDSTIYLMVKDNLHDAFASLGAQIVLNDGADAGGGDCIGYNVAGYDVIGLPYEKKYSAIKLDVSVVVATPGTNNVDYFQYNGTEAGLTHTAILQVGYGSIHLIKGQGTIPNTFMDGIYYIANGSYAASITGGTTGTPETMADLVGDDITVGAGMFSNPVGAAYYIFAPTEWGAATGDTAFAGTDEQWYYLGDNGGGHAVGAGNFFHRLLGGTGTNIFRQTRVTNINVGTRAAFDWSHASFDEITLDSTTWVEFGVITAPGVDVDKNLDVAVFNNCDQFIMNGMNCSDLTFNGAFNALGAVLLDTSGDSNNCVGAIFNSDGTGHAIEISVAGTYDFDNFIFVGYGADATTDAAVYISANVAVTLNIQNGGDTPTVRNSGTAPTINNAVTITIDGVAQGTAGTMIANETVGTVTIGDVLLSGLADSTGAITDTGFNYEAAFGAGLDVLVRARSQGLPNAAIADDNGVYTDQTTEANSSAVGDMNLLPVTPVVNEDRYLFGHSEQFSQLKVNVSTAGTGGFTITWQYWNGAWTALTGVTDGTSSFSVAGESIISFTLPGDWATTTVNSQGPFYYIRAAYTAGTVTVTPLGRAATLDVTRYLPIPPSGNLVRTITSAGLTATLSQAVDSIAQFNP
jgi:hypothetical protein